MNLKFRLACGVNIAIFENKLAILAAILVFRTVYLILKVRQRPLDYFGMK